MEILKKIIIKSEFFAQLDLSEKTRLNYKNALNSIFLKNFLIEECNKESLFDIYDLEELWNIYSEINLHPQNISKHRMYSAAIMKYIRFLNGGKKYGKRIDYQKPRPKRNRENEDSI